jgi:hypothetical protein
MPELSRFFGIIVMMFCNDHPPPHFRVRYAGAMLGRRRSLLSIRWRSWQVAFRRVRWGWSWSGQRRTKGNCAKPEASPNFMRR